MPVLISNGRPFRVSLMSLLTGSVREGRPSLRYDTRSVSADFYQDIPRARARSRREQVNSRTHTIQWSSEDDRVLRELKASKVSWKRISMVMDDRPIAELKKRWIDIQDDKHKACEVRKVYGLDEVDGDWYFDEEYDKERHVSFSSSTDEDEDEDEDEDTEEDDSLSRRPKTKSIYYIDNEFTLDEVLLLHQIAADWKKDRWKTISSRFNEKTGRDITPGQAKSVIDD